MSNTHPTSQSVLNSLLDHNVTTFQSVLNFLLDHDVPSEQAATLALAAEMVEELYHNEILDETPFERVAKGVAEDLCKAPFKKN
jgi:hypothetical protein